MRNIETSIHRLAIPKKLREKKRPHTATGAAILLQDS